MRPKTVRLIQSDGSIHEYDATGHDLHIDQPLTEVLINYRPTGMIADQVLPLVEVGKQSDLYYEFDQGDLWRIPDTVRAPMTGAKMVSFNVSSNTYFAKNYALAAGIPVEDAMNADAALRLRESKGRFIMDLLTLDWENRLATLVINTSNVGTFATVTGSLWSNHADSAQRRPVLPLEDDGCGTGRRGCSIWSQPCFAPPFARADYRHRQASIASAHRQRGLNVHD